LLGPVRSTHVASSQSSQLRVESRIAIFSQLSTDAMRYAVLQTDLNPPAIDQLQRAFKSVPGLTAGDAFILGNDAFGILVKDVSEAQAGALQGALRIEGLESEIVDHTLLPPLPPTHIVRRMECSPESLMIFDPLGRQFALEWQHVACIATGAVRLTDFVQRKHLVSPVARRGATDVTPNAAEFETRTHEERRFHLLGEIIITGAALRYSFTADKFNFAGLGDRNMANTVANFSLFVRDLIQFSPNAVLNRGAEALRANATEILSYPTKNAFYEEIVWMLWQMKKAA
jgi:hypothetical protein